MDSPRTSPGYYTALCVLEAGREAFFGAREADLPRGRAAQISRDDVIPQFGYVGAKYSESKVLLLGINPGNGPNDNRNAGDAIVMPPLHRFFADRSKVSFVEAQKAYQKVCTSWPIWRRHCSEIIRTGRFSMDDIAYSNCLPWRTASESGFADSVAVQAARLYAYPLIAELEPRVVIALGKRAATILALGGKTPTTLITWNRAQAATDAVRRDRDATARQIMRYVGRT